MFETLETWQSSLAQAARFDVGMELRVFDV
jgi:hypothetical protein